LATRGSATTSAHFPRRTTTDNRRRRATRANTGGCQPAPLDRWSDASRSVIERRIPYFVGVGVVIVKTPHHIPRRGQCRCIYLRREDQRIDR
jgi:hypothetical protein